MRYIDSGVREVDQTVGNWMREVLTEPISAFRCQAGYFTLEGAGLILPSLQRLATDGSTVRLLLGSNGGSTLASHISFLAGALGLPRDNVSMSVIAYDGGLFHPKVYHFLREDGTQTAYVGSANLTGPAISGLNIEAGVILDSKHGDNADVLQEIVLRIESWFKGEVPGASSVRSSSDIEALLEEQVLSLARVAAVAPDMEEHGELTARVQRKRHRLQGLVTLPQVGETTLATTTLRVSQPILRHTEASFHYPQGTHLGHILGILYYFSGDRTDTPYDDEYIRLSGSLGTGRVAGFRRQVKYKMLAAIELGLISDIRLAEDTSKYAPMLTAKGARLWALIRPHVNTSDLELSVGDDGEFSSRMKSAGFYNEALKTALSASPELRGDYERTFLNMPAVKQMLAYLYHTEQRAVVEKSQIYRRFFDAPATRAFCDEMGIEPATHEGARHRCPFLLNILESCDVITQDTGRIRLQKLAVSPDLLTRDGVGTSQSRTLYTKVVASWPQPTGLSGAEVSSLRDLFGDKFLTKRYHLNELVAIPGANGEPIT